MSNRRTPLKGEFNIYGVTLIVCSIVMYFLVGTSISFGIIIRYLLQNLQGGKGETTWIASVNTGLMYGFSPVAGIIERKHGSRLLLFLGSLLGTTGLVLSFFVPSLHYLYVTYGVISGCGFSMVLHSSIIPIMLHFNKKRNLANAIGSLGTGLGITLWPLLMTMLVENYGWRGSFLILGGAFLQTMICGMLIGSKYKKTDSEGPALLDKKDTVDNGNGSFVEDIKSIFGNTYFIIYVIAGTVSLSGMVSPYIFLPDLGNSRGLNAEQQAMLLTVSGIATTCERPVIGPCLDKARSYLIFLMGVCAFIQGIATIGLSFINQYQLFLFYATFLGITNGIYQLVQSVCLISIVQRKQFSLAVGIFRFFLGIGVTIGPPIAGWITDYRGKYDWACYYTGTMLLSGGTTLCAINIILRKRKHNIETDYVVEINKETFSEEIVVNTNVSDPYI